MWVGNVLVCDNQAVKVTLVVDGQAPGAPPFVELHNPMDQPVTTRVWSPAHAPLFGGFSTQVQIPAGDSLRLPLPVKSLPAK
jgi:hypothetical protein